MAQHGRRKTVKAPRCSAAERRRRAVIMEALAVAWDVGGELCNDGPVAYVAHQLGIPFRVFAEMVVERFGVPRRALLNKASLDEYAAGS